LLSPPLFFPSLLSPSLLSPSLLSSSPIPLPFPCPLTSLRNAANCVRLPKGGKDSLLERRKQKREERGYEWLREREGRRQGRRERDLRVGKSQSGGEGGPMNY